MNDQAIETTAPTTGPAGRGRRRRKKRSTSWTLGDFLRAFLLMNVIPLIAAVVIAILWYRGDIESFNFPEGSTPTLLTLGGILVALVLFASITLPSAHRAVGAVEHALAARREVLGGRAPGSRFGALLALPFLALVYLVLWPLRLVLMLVSVVLIAAFIVFCIRLLVPDFLQVWIDEALRWVGAGTGKET